MVELITGTLGLLNAQKGKIKYTFPYIITYAIILQSLKKIGMWVVFETPPFTAQKSQVTLTSRQLPGDLLYCDVIFSLS